MLKNTTDSYEGGKLPFMNYESFRATGAFEAVQGPSDLFNIRLHNDDVQDFDSRWDQALSAASEIPTEMILDGLYKSKLQDSVQLQTALAMYEQENIRNNGQPSCSRLKTAVRRHNDQVMRTRNFRARSEIVERGTVLLARKLVRSISVVLELFSRFEFDFCRCGNYFQKTIQNLCVCVFGVHSLTRWLHIYMCCGLLSHMC